MSRFRPILREAVAEFIGTAFLLAAIVGSGIMAQRLCGGNVGLELLANSIVTGGALMALILTFGPLSGAHFNPVVTMAMAVAGKTRPASVLPYIAAQCAGAVIGVWAAHVMFDLPVLQISAHARSGTGQWAGEFIATFGLVAVIESGRRHVAAASPAAIALYIVAAYWFTSSTSFANPAVTLARSLTDSFAGIAPGNVAGFVAAQVAGAAAAIVAMRWLNAERLATAVTRRASEP